MDSARGVRQATTSFGLLRRLPARCSDSAAATITKGAKGRVEQKLASFGRIKGFVFGAVGESSPDVAEFIKDLAVLGAERKWRRMGARNIREARGLIKGLALQAIGIAAVRSAARCKLDRAAEARDGWVGLRARPREDPSAAAKGAEQHSLSRARSSGAAAPGRGSRRRSTGS